MPDLSSVAREAAEAEGLRRIPESPMAFHGGVVVDMAKFDRSHFIDGFTECASRLPDRETIAEALWNFPINGISLARLSELAKTGEGDYQETLDYLYEQADAVLALIEARMTK